MIHILLFADLQENLGKASLEYKCDSITIRELKVQLKTAYGLSKIDQVMMAINEEYATEDDIVKSGDTVAFIPPVSGG
ncbi:molybdopterin converting factor subunit 1 [Oceanobacillus timonensis]|uniref:molybdopterin converting factor subunit 1 n=1 Tax=Oceanobacillus timonensis TaxID=1926285 RepID=UPI0009BAD225|nr:molybdopterin converting factor subunit 1 [Oceanobacillus timonensis]